MTGRQDDRQDDRQRILDEYMIDPVLYMGNSIVTIHYRISVKYIYILYLEGRDRI
jgi:hypothetical protein